MAVTTRRTSFQRLRWPTVAITLSLLAAGGTHAQSDDRFADTATALELYEASRNSCSYAPVVGEVLAKLSNYYARVQPYLWEKAKREVTDAHVVVGNMGILMNSTSTLDLSDRSSPHRTPPQPQPKVSNCQLYGQGIGMAMMGGILVAGVDPTLMTEANRLMNGGGRELPQSPSQDDDQPGGQMSWHRQGQTIAFGIPETDERSIVVDCKSRKLLLRGPLAAQAEAGRTVPVIMTGLGQYQTLQGSVVEAGDGLNYEATVSPSSVPIATLLSDQPLTMAVPGGSTVIPSGGASLMRKFVSTCLASR